MSGIKKLESCPQFTFKKILCSLSYFNFNCLPFLKISTLFFSTIQTINSTLHLQNILKKHSKTLKSMTINRVAVLFKKLRKNRGFIFSAMIKYNHKMYERAYQCQWKSNFLYFVSVKMSRCGDFSFSLFKVHTKKCRIEYDSSSHRSFMF